MEDFIKELKEYFETTNGEKYDEDPYEWIRPEYDNPKLYEKIWDLLFIGSHFNSDTTRELRNAGFSVRATDRDSFGILVACIFYNGKAISIG